jgi:hypothetical protein
VTPARFSLVWDRRGPQNDVKELLTPDERKEVDERWETMPPSCAWVDAFHSLWRTTAPSAHSARFLGTFYASAESMQARDYDDEEHRCTGCSGADLNYIGTLGLRDHFRCRDCGLNQSRGKS